MRLMANFMCSAVFEDIGICIAVIFDYFALD